MNDEWLRGERSAGFRGNVGEEVLEAIAVFFGDDYSNSHAQAGLDALHERWSAPLRDFYAPAGAA